MKTFYVSLAVFSLLIALIVCNGIYVRKATEKIEGLLEQALVSDIASLLPIEHYWQRTKKMLALTAPFEEIRFFDEHLIAMRAAAKAGAYSDFERSRLLAAEVLCRIRGQEEFSLDNLL